ncbi:MAG: N-acetylmuramoyl-L-alanine amidase [Candidatus Woesearchaeota archaeon]
MGIESFIDETTTLINQDSTCDRRTMLKQGLVGLAILLLPSYDFAKTTAKKIKITPHLSRHAHRRPFRPDTKYIILHTTEANDESSINSVTKDGTANYVVTTNGKIYMMIPQNKLAKHAGRSMWNGLTNLSNHSVGIEIAGFHDKPITAKQYTAATALIQKLQIEYRLSDNKVLPHSMVACNNPNEWYDYPFRGRRLCGMYFGTDAVRKKLGLTEKPSYDPDVKEGRLILSEDIGTYLTKLFWGKKGIVPQPMHPKPQPSEDDTDRIQYIGNKKDKKDGLTAWSIAKNLYATEKCIYLLTDGKIRTGAELKKEDKELLNRLPEDTGMLVGYVNGGRIQEDRTAYEAVGKKWDYDSTFYVTRNKKTNKWVIKTGDDIDDQKIPPDTWVFFRN